MTTRQQVSSLVSEMEKSVNAALEYFAGPGKDSEVKVGTWSPREVLCHMLYWHQATVEGIEAVAKGGKPVQIYAPVDEMNARAVGRASGKGMEQLIDEARKLQARLIKVVRALPDPDVIVVVRADGAQTSARQRLQRIADHWAEHITELQEVAK